MKATLNFLNSNKAYVGLAIGGLVWAAQYLGVPVPGVQFDGSAFETNAWSAALVLLAHHDGSVRAASK